MNALASDPGLRGHAIERGVRRRIGLAPQSGRIDPNPPFLRIATEEAWSFPELVEAQLCLLNRRNPPDDPSLRMAGMFATMPALQAMLFNLGAERIAHMDELGIARQLLLLTAPGVQVLEPAEGTALARSTSTPPHPAIASRTLTAASPAPWPGFPTRCGSTPWA